MPDETETFDIILHAGNAKSYAMEAIEASRERQYDEADSLLKKAHEELIEAHKKQSRFLFEHADNKAIDVDVFLIHAMDHNSMASITLEFAEEIVLLRKERDSQ